MNLQQFGNGFKSKINNRKGELRVDAIPNFFTGAYHYKSGDSGIINGFWNNSKGPKDLFEVENIDWKRTAGGTNDYQLGERCGRLFEAGWNLEDILIYKNEDIQVRINDKNFNRYDFIVNFIGSRVNAQFIYDFRRFGGDAGKTAKINAVDIIQYIKHSDDETEHLTAEQAGAAFNNGWKNSAEIKTR